MWMVMRKKTWDINVLGCIELIVCKRCIIVVVKCVVKTHEVGAHVHIAITWVRVLEQKKPAQYVVDESEKAKLEKVPCACTICSFTVLTNLSVLCSQTIILVQQLHSSGFLWSHRFPLLDKSFLRYICLFLTTCTDTKTRIPIFWNKLNILLMNACKLTLCISSSLFHQFWTECHSWSPPYTNILPQDIIYINWGKDGL